MSFFIALFYRYRWFFSKPAHIQAFALGGALLLLGSTLNVIANVYATERASNFVTDIVLSNTTPWDVDGVFVYGTFAVVFFAGAIAVLYPHYFPFMGASLGLFYVIRTCFVSLTHMGPFPDRAVIDVGTFMEKVLGGGDMFFSGHTGAPFLLALIFWHLKPLRYAFLAWSVFFAAVVLLGHLHYSIDVLAAFFITYATFDISKLLFSEYRNYFDASPV